MSSRAKLKPGEESDEEFERAVRARSLAQTGGGSSTFAGRVNRGSATRDRVRSLVEELRQRYAAIDVYLVALAAWSGTTTPAAATGATLLATVRDVDPLAGHR